MYDIKSMYNQAKNVVLNVSEMEAKVREATNDDPWGASSTLMNEIAQGTFNFAHFNEIMPCIYGRFMEKEARQWRQIYKALQLLEYLVKNGSERVVDDARSHMSTIKMLRNFHYIDDKGKDEGINVRNRSKELVELLADVEKIRSERRKAKANKSKFTGVGSDGYGMSSGGGGGRYGGFGSDSVGGGGGGSSWNDHYTSGGGSSSYDRGNDGYSGSAGRSSYNDHTGARRQQFEEYDAGGDEIRTGSSKQKASSSARTAPPTKAAPPPPPAPAPVVDLLGGFDDDSFGAPVPAPAPAANNKALPAVSLDDDDFSDFQPAPVAAAPVAPSQPAFAPVSAKPNLMDLLQAQRPASTPAVQPQAPPSYGGFNMSAHRPTPSFSTGQFGSPMAPMQPQQSLFGGRSMTPVSAAASTMRPGSTPATAPKPAASSSNFDDLWSLSLGASASKVATNNTGGGKSIQALQKEKAQANIWGGGAPQARPAGQPAFPAFGGSYNAGSSSGGADDLLL